MNGKQAKLNDAFQFLKAGLDSNEVVMIITDDMSKDAVRQKMRQEWQVDIAKLEASGDIVIKETKEWYYPQGKVDATRIFALWTALAELATVKGKKGLRVFGDFASFFRHGYGKDLLNYEAKLEKNFDIPVTALCAYESKDLVPGQADRLKEHHCVAWD